MGKSSKTSPVEVGASAGDCFCWMQGCGGWAVDVGLWMLGEWFWDMRWG